MTVPDTISLQRELQNESFDVDPESLEGDELAEFLRWNFLAAIDELCEALHEVPGWKPWSSKETGVLADTTEGDMVGAELIDAQHFINNVFLAIGWDDERVREEYAAKVAVNAQRQREGYAR